MALLRSRYLTLATIFVVTLTVGLTACGKNKNRLPGIDQFSAGVVHSRLYVSLLSLNLSWDYGFTLPVPGLSDAFISVAPDLNSNGTIFQFNVGLESLINQGKPLPHAGLPDGRMIPNVNGGVLPRWDVSIEGIPLSLYLSDDAFGLFIPIQMTSRKFRLKFSVSVTITDERGNRLGRAYWIPQNSARSGSGILILLPYLGTLPQ